MATKQSMTVLGFSGYPVFHVTNVDLGHLHSLSLYLMVSVKNVSTLERVFHQYIRHLHFCPNERTPLRVVCVFFLRFYSRLKYPVETRPLVFDMF